MFVSTQKDLNKFDTTTVKLHNNKYQMLLPNISVRTKARDVLRTVICSNCVRESQVDDGRNVDIFDDEYASAVHDDVYTGRDPVRRLRKKTTDVSPVCVASLTYNNTTYRCGSIDELERIIRTRIPELYKKLCKYCPRPKVKTSTT